MSKAKDVALKAYPKDIKEFVGVNGMKSVVDYNSWQRTIFLNGYHQAEKELALTWEDLKMIDDISDNVYAECDVEMFDEKKYYQEVLKRFKERKDKL